MEVENTGYVRDGKACISVWKRLGDLKNGNGRSIWKE